jgi:hypothetical protein
LQLENQETAMPDEIKQPPKEIQDINDQLPDAGKGTIDSFNVKEGEGFNEELVDAIEMIGEEKAAGYEPAARSQITPGMRYLHSSRTIHQLVTDRNRAVGIYLAVASLLLTASGAILNANPQGELMVPTQEIQRWCFPITFATLTVLALFMALLLIRTRVGLIYEVAKMNVWLGLPIGRVQRLSPLSVHSVLHAIISFGGGASAGLFAIFMARLAKPEEITSAVWIGVLVGVLVTVALIFLYVVTVSYTTADHRLQAIAEPAKAK